ncbi:MAG: Asp-tRNA(Asn)/Glu-tRNA(Gln) amidotransferase subunit GatC [Patescibacteria group bacterium]|mgnify:CR=1 FL=1
MKLDDIKKLAEMARIDMSDEELVEIAKDFDSILAYVGQIQEISELSDTKKDYALENVMREDVITNKSGEYTDSILAQMPDTQDGFLKVKQIL